MRYDAVTILSAGDMSSSSLTSIGVDLQQMFGFSIQAVMTDAPVGTLKLQVSNDIVQPSLGTDPAANVTNWIDYTGSSQSISAAGNFLWDVADANYRWVRAVYTKTSGTGALTFTFFGKGI